MNSTLKNLSLLLVYLLLSVSELIAAKKEDRQIDFNFELSAECEPLSCIADCVNVSSGSFFQIDKDIKGNTIDPISFIRFYDSGSRTEMLLGSQFGSQFPLFCFRYNGQSKEVNAMISERDGFLIPYTKGEIANSYKVSRQILAKGYTNLSRAEIAGQENFVNRRASIESNSKGEVVSLRLGNGAKRTYKNSHELNYKNRRDLCIPSRHVLLLDEEIKANGNILKFNYNVIDGKPCLSKVQTFNRTRTAILNELLFEYTPTECTICTTGGLSGCYTQKISDYSDTNCLRERRFLKKVLSSNLGLVTYNTNANEYQIQRINDVIKANGYLMSVTYDKSGRVQKLLKRFSLDQPPATLYKFAYEKSKTSVWNALDQLAIYRFDEDNRLNAVEYFNDKIPFKQEVFEWSKSPSQKGWLESKSVQKNGRIFTLKKYEYDSRGNIIRETKYGNATGRCAEYFSLQQIDTVDQYSIEYAYTADNRNLLVQKKTPEGLTVSYDYLPDTNLRIRELQTYEGRIQERFFYSYDENGQVNLKIEDNGSGSNESDLTDVTYRIITKTTASPDQGKAWFGKPSIIKKSYLDLSTGLQIPITRSEFSYDSYGNEVHVKEYDSQGTLCYETSRNYDARQRLISEIDSVGRLFRYEYDENNNRTKEELCGSGKVTTYNYDCANRLVLKTDVHNDGKTFEISYVYNNLDQLVSETDAYGQKTTYSYDRFGNQIQCVKGSIDGCSRTKSSKYNILNQPYEKTDENGHTISYKYNIYGSPTLIRYPDGAEEQFIYSESGLLKEKILADKTRVVYEYDSKKHLLSVEYFDQEGRLLSDEKYIYKGKFLIAQKDTTGISTRFEYDCVGRKTREVIGESKVIEFKYDDFGRVIAKIEGVEPEQRRYHYYQYDALDRITSEISKDSSQKTRAKKANAYDILGNLSQESIYYADDKVAHYQFQYNSDGTIAWKENPLAERTLFEYNHHFQNANGERVVCKSVLYPSGKKKIEIYDIYGQCVEKNMFADGVNVSRTAYAYDGLGNLTTETAYVMHEGRLIREFAVERVYNNRGFIASETETPDLRKIETVYDLKGRRIEKRKMDGSSIHYTYDGLDRVIGKKSSGQSINYIYEYDQNGNITKIKDLVLNNELLREYDPLNRLIREEISVGVVLAYTYDILDRLTRVTLPDNSSIAYEYTPFHLTRITRFDPTNCEMYSYKISDYDLKDNILATQSDAGKVTYEYDLLGRAIRVNSEHWESTLKKFDLSGNLLESTLRNPDGILQKTFSYDALNHLKSENSLISDLYEYDSLGNCFQKNGSKREFNHSNQLLNVEISEYQYDANGNLTKQHNPEIDYEYDPLNRLTSRVQNGELTKFEYDAFDRCVKINYPNNALCLLHMNGQEIGSYANGTMNELRVTHPEAKYEKTFSIELQNSIYFSVQDQQHNVCGLYDRNRSLIQLYDYSAFGIKIPRNESLTQNPWQFANRRGINELTLFNHRFYNASIMRWQTMDPLGYADGLNAYNYVHNNPLVYRDPDGRVIIPLFVIAFETATTTFALPSLATVTTAALVAATTYTVYSIDRWYATNALLDSLDEYDTLKDTKKKKPPYDGQILGDDPSKCPGEGFEWKGRGEPGKSPGAWYNPVTDESLYPDLNHGPPVGPHWDYRFEDERARLFPDGTWEYK